MVKCSEEGELQKLINGIVQNKYFDGKKTYVGLALVAVGVYFANEALVQAGLLICGFGFAHKLNKINGGVV